MPVRPFSLLGQGTLDAVAAALGQAVAQWSQQWGAPSALFSVAAERGYDAATVQGLPAPAWASCQRAGERAVWWACHGELQADLQHALFAPDGGYGPQSEQLPHFAALGARQALDALMAALTGAALPGADAPASADLGAGMVAEAAAAQARGAGAVRVLLRAGRHQCRLLLNDAAVRALCPPARPALTPLAAVNYQQALAAVPVTLELRAGAAQVALGNLLTLGVGDVIRLDAAVDAPLALHAPSGAPLLGGYLGRTGEQVAVELVNRHSS